MERKSEKVDGKTNKLFSKHNAELVFMATYLHTEH